MSAPCIDAAHPYVSQAYLTHVVTTVDKASVMADLASVPIYKIRSCRYNKHHGHVHNLCHYYNRHNILVQTVHHDFNL